MPKNTPDDFALDLEVLRQFRVIFKSVRRHFQSIEDATGVSGSQLWAAATIADTPGMRVTELARAMSIHQTTASNLVEKLVGLDLVRRERSETDSRAVSLYITETGQQRLDSAPGPYRGLLPDALGKLPYASLVDLHHNLAELLLCMRALDAQEDGDTPLADI